MVEFEVDMACLLEDGELDCVVLNDENGEHPSMQFEPSRGECHIKPWRMEPDTGAFDCMECDSCGHVMDVSEWSRANYCPNCGAKVVEQ